MATLILHDTPDIIQELCTFLIQDGVSCRIHEPGYLTVYLRDMPRDEAHTVLEKDHTGMERKNETFHA